MMQESGEMLDSGAQAAFDRLRQERYEAGFRVGFEARVGGAIGVPLPAEGAYDEGYVDGFEDAGTGWYQDATAALWRRSLRQPEHDR